MQERVLHLGQHLAEELEHLLPHAWRVLRARGQDACPERKLRPRLERAPPRCSEGTSAAETGLVCTASSLSCSLFLHNLVVTERATRSLLCLNQLLCPQRLGHSLALGWSSAHLCRLNEREPFLKLNDSENETLQQRSKGTSGER